MRIVQISTLAFLCFFSFGWGQGSLTLDKIVAQVGDDIILYSDVINTVKSMPSPVEDSRGQSCNLLEGMMIDRLMVNQAKLDSVIIADEQVDAEMENRIRLMQQQLATGRQTFEEYYGMTINAFKDKFRELVRERMLADEIRNSLTMGVSVTPKEVTEFYQNLPADSIPYMNMQLGFQQIVIYPEISKEDKKLAIDKLTGIRSDIVDRGKSFESMARIHSMDPGSAPMGGKIVGRKGMMVSEFEATLFKLKPGEVSSVIETEFGYHIIKLISRVGEEFTCLHILIRPEFSTKSMNLVSQRLDSCYTLLKQNKITWDQAVLRYSNDERTKQNQGMLTNPRSGAQTWDMQDLNDIDQQIYLLTDAMEKGDITSPSLYVDIFTNKQGVRIVRLNERIPAHQANLDQDYALIKGAAESEKRQKVVDRWVADKLSSFYIRLDEQYQNCTMKFNWLNQKKQ